MFYICSFIQLSEKPYKDTHFSYSWFLDETTTTTTTKAQSGALSQSHAPAMWSSRGFNKVQQLALVTHCMIQCLFKENRAISPKHIRASHSLFHVFTHENNADVKKIIALVASLTDQVHQGHSGRDKSQALSVLLLAPTISP